MTRRPSHSASTQPSPLSTSEELRQGIARLKKRLDETRAFEPTSVVEQSNIPHVEALAAAVNEALMRTFGADTHEYKLYSDAANFDNGPFNYMHTVPITQVHESLARSKSRSIALLEGAITSLEERLTEFPAAPPSPAPRSKPSRKVFVVHGRDDAMKNDVALFLSSIGLEPIILHTRPHRGRGILTKFQEESEGAGFAVILMTPDDEGALVGGTPRKRARQNVVFELGFFIGKLDTRNVAALVKGHIEKPSDFDGIGYIEFDPNGEWKRLLAREMHDVGVPFDATKVFRA